MQIYGFTKILSVAVTCTTLLLLAHIQAALVAAALNISIPLELGQLVNAVAQLQPGQEPSVYASQLLHPGARLVGLYCIQVCHKHINSMKLPTTVQPYNTHARIHTWPGLECSHIWLHLSALPGG